MKCSICGIDLEGVQYPVSCIQCGAPLCDDCSLENNFKCNKCNGIEDHNIELDFVRRSYIETYKICPHAFELLAIDKVETPNSIYANVGIKLHELFEEASLDRLNKPDMIKQFTDWYNTLKLEDFDGYQTKLSTEEFKKHMYDVGLRNIDNFFVINTCMSKPYQTETTLFTVVHPDLPKIRITFDRINKNEDGTYDLVDYKTGKVYVGKKLKEDLQIPLYIYSVQQNLGITINKFELLFTGEGKKRVYERITEDSYMCTVGKKNYIVSLSKAIDEIINIFTQIKNGKLGIPHDLSPWYCEHMCMLKKGGHCAGKFTQQWRE